ncbi:MAG: PhoPQ-activated protein PqaA family protein [Fuerstiella sp.]
MTKNIVLTGINVCLLLLFPGYCSGAEDADEVIPDAIHRYVNRAEPDFAWQKGETLDTEAGRVHQLRVTSQKWQGTVWNHAVEIYEPKEVAFPRHALLFVTGGSRPKAPDEDDLKMGLSLAKMCGARVVMLHQVPNQPLLGGRKEDDLITESWLKYLDTGDDSWPILFAMVKSAVKTMDAVQELSRAEWDEPIEHFVITGASKRGWTSWLTPVADPRVIGTAPIVIDVLNFRAQMQHQLNSWGQFSEQIIDYTSKGLVKRPDEEESPREVALRRMMDPFTYRQKLSLPKLLIVGTNDRYWVVDSMNLYWDDLVGNKYIRQVPNAGHGLDGGREGALTTLAVFFRSVAAGVEPPRISWKFSNGGRQLKLAMESDPVPARVRLWTVQSDDLDFRDDQWKSTEVDRNGGRPEGTVQIPETGHVAMFGELEFDFQGLPWSLTTLVFRN